MIQARYSLEREREKEIGGGGQNRQCNMVVRLV